MSLTGAMLIGRSALSASSLGIQVAGNNIANAATPGYSRQIANLASLVGGVAGAGVQVRAIQRQIDEALQARLWGGIAEETATARSFQILSSIEATLGELASDDHPTGLSGELSTFFSTWSEQANASPSASVVVQQGIRMAEFMNHLRSDLVAQTSQIDRELGAAAQRADTLLATIADLNVQVAASEVDGSVDNALRDQRDQAVSELSTLMDVSVAEQPNGAMNILVGSTPVVLEGVSRGVTLRRETVDGELRVALVSGTDGEELRVTSGQMGALLAGRSDSVSDTVQTLDRLAAQVIFEVNKLHSTATSRNGLTSASGSLNMSAADRAMAMNDPANTALAGLPFEPVNGGFLVHITSRTSGQTQTVRIDVDLDGLTNAGVPGTGDDTSAEDIRAALDAVDGLSASFGGDGRLQISSDDGFSFSFGDDTSGALAVLGINSFFTGTDAADIAVREDLTADPSRLMMGRIVDGTFVENGTALEIVRLQDRSIDSLGGVSIRQSWTDAVQAVAIRVESSESRANATSLVRQSLQAQRDSMSAVSIDEESINLLAFQQQYQGAARVISIADELLRTLMASV